MILVKSNNNNRNPPAPAVIIIKEYIIYMHECTFKSALPNCGILCFKENVERENKLLKAESCADWMPPWKSCWAFCCVLLTYSTGEFACALLQQPDYLSLLSGGTSAANHSGTLTCKLHELILVVFQTNLQETHPNGQVSTMRPPHITDLNCGSLTPQLNLQFNSYCGSESDSNHRYHFQRGFSGSDIIMHHTENKSEFHKER